MTGGVVSCCDHPAPVRWLLVGPLGLSVACERCRASRTRALRRHFEELTWRVAKPWLIRPERSGQGGSTFEVRGFASDTSNSEPRTPCRSTLGVLLLAFVLTGYGAGTEQFIPIGQSPGVSGKRSLAGTIIKADPATKLICLQEGQGVRSSKFEVPTTSNAEHRTCIAYSHAMAVYLDRSHLKQQNTIGGWQDLRIGQTVEIYPQHWIKVRMEE